MKVIGETQSLLQFEALHRSCRSPNLGRMLHQGGKTAPKSHENSGWKWVAGDLEKLAIAARVEDAVFVGGMLSDQALSILQIREEEESKQSAAEAGADD